jgi:hypothetical protein
MDKHGFPQDCNHDIHNDCIGTGCDCEEKTKGMSTFRAVLCTVGSFVGAAIVLMILGVDFEKVPIIAILLAIAVCAVIIGTISAMRKQ